MSESYAETWDAERAYKRLKKCIIQMQANENPNTMLVCTQYQLRMSLCSNGSMPVDLFEQALQQLETHKEIAYGDRYVSYPSDRQMGTDAIEWVASQEEVDREFIGSMNQLLSSGELDT